MKSKLKMLYSLLAGGLDLSRAELLCWLQLLRQATKQEAAYIVRLNCGLAAEQLRLPRRVIDAAIRGLEELGLIVSTGQPREFELHATAAEVNHATS